MTRLVEGSLKSSSVRRQSAFGLSDSPCRRRAMLRTKHATRTTKMTAKTGFMLCLRGLSECDHRAVGDDLGQGVADFGGVEAHGDYPFAADQLRVLDHPVQRVSATVLDQSGVL